MPNEIQSLTNPKIKNLIKLRKSFSKNDGLAVIDGVREIDLALKACVPIEEVYYCPGIVKNQQMIKRVEAAATDVYSVSKDVFEKIHYGDKHDGMVVICRPIVKTFEDLRIKNNSLVLVVENVEKPGNLGAILRSCDGAGVDAVIVCDQQTALFNSNVIRSSLGCIFSLPVVAVTNQQASDFLMKNGFTVFVTTPAAKERYDQVDLTKKTAIVVGREDEGVSDFWMKAANQRVSIPMKGIVDSLNVSCAAAILLYEAVRQRVKT